MIVHVLHQKVDSYQVLWYRHHYMFLLACMLHCSQYSTLFALQKKNKKKQLRDQVVYSYQCSYITLSGSKTAGICTLPGAAIYNKQDTGDSPHFQLLTVIDGKPRIPSLVRYLKQLTSYIHTFIVAHWEFPLV